MLRGFGMNKFVKMSDRELGRRLRCARTNANLTQDEAANEIGVARTTLIAMEKGERTVRPYELRALANIYGQPLNRLLQDDSVEIDIVGRFRRRINGKSGAQDGDTALKMMGRFVTTTVELERHLGVNCRANYPPQVSIKSGRLQDLAEDAALAVRQHLGVGIGPVQDVVSLIEIELGARVFVTPLPPDISGAFAFDPSVGACILVNALHPRTRRNMTAAHELGHLVGSRDIVELNASRYIEDSREERFATLFGAAFLMPAPWVRRRFSDIIEQGQKFSPRDLVLLSESAFVSPEAMCRRLESLGLLKSGMWESLIDRGFNTKFLKSLERAEQASESRPIPPRLAWLAAAAVERGMLSEGQLVERLGIDRAQVREMLDEMLTD